MSEWVVASVLTEPCTGIGRSEGELPGGVQELLVAVAVRNFILIPAHTHGRLSV